MSQIYVGLYVGTRYSCQVLIKFDFSENIFENSPKSTFLNIRPVGAELFHTHRPTDIWNERTDGTNFHLWKFCERT